MAIEIFPTSSVRFDELSIIGNSSEESPNDTGEMPFRMKYIGFSYSDYQASSGYKIYFTYPLQEDSTAIFIQGSIARTNLAYARPFYHQVKYDASNTLSKFADYPNYDSSLVSNPLANSIASVSISSNTLYLRLPLAGAGFYKIGGIARIYEGTFPNI